MSGHGGKEDYYESEEEQARRILDVLTDELGGIGGIAEVVGSDSGLSLSGDDETTTHAAADELQTSERTDGTASTEIAIKESRQVWMVRTALVLSILVVTVTISSVVFLYLRRKEEEAFESHYYTLAQKLADALEDNAARRLGAIQSLAVTIASNAKSLGQSWPNVTVDDFEERVGYTLNLAEVISIIMIPFVSTQDRPGWEEYSIKNQGWLHDSLAYQADHAVPDHHESDEQKSIDMLESTWGVSSNSSMLSIPEEIFRINDTGVQEETGPGPYAPWWQFAPAFSVPALVNYNTLSNPTRNASLRPLMETQQPLMSEAWDSSVPSNNNPETVAKTTMLNLFLNRNRNLGHSYQDGPISDMYFPIFEASTSSSNSNGTLPPLKVVGTLTAMVYWQLHFDSILTSTSGLLALLENSCSQQFSYSVMGEETTYLGPGDLHDPKYNDFVVITRPFLSGEDPTTRQQEEPQQQQGQCIYSVRIFPTQDLEDEFLTNTPLVVTMILVSAFLFMSLAFVVYDFAVETRNAVVMKQAVRSTEVVNSLYPANVQERLFDDDETSIKSEKSVQRRQKQQQQRMLRNSGNLGLFGMTKAVPSMLGFAKQSSSALTHSARVSTNGSSHLPLDPLGESTMDDSGIYIADLYQNTTVLFADLAGFTSWANGRDPKMVFRLLETLYGAFDEIAKRRLVFKIETIGDCWLGITGCPYPNEKHAVAMARFAGECISRMNLLIHKKLVRSLGIETADLRLRIGMNSGSVTAGVLRGERARFQLFGDVVNTAARMESTGIPGRIQCSESTAELLIAAGKEEWVQERDGGVEAKGKGQLRTFWVEPPTIGRAAGTVTTMTPDSSVEKMDSDDTNITSCAKSA